MVPLDIHHLRAVAAIAKFGSFSKAAEELYTSQSNLSQNIAKLEKEIGYPLFQRTTKCVNLTPLGVKFLEDTKPVLKKFDLLQEQVLATRTALEHSVNVGVSMIYRPETSWLITDFMQKHPEIDLSLVSEWELEILEHIRARRIDVGLFGVDWGNDNLTDVLVQPIRDERVVVALSANHPLAHRECIRIQELVSENIVFSSGRSGVRRMIMQKFRDHHIRPKRVQEMTDTETRMYYVSQNMAITFTMDSTYHWKNRSDICTIPVEPPLVRTYALVMLTDTSERNPIAIRCLRDFLLDNFEKNC